MLKLKTTLLAAAATIALGACTAMSGDSGVYDTTLAPTWPALEAQSGAAASGFDTAGLEGLAASMQGFVDDGHVLGMQTLLVKDGEVVQHGLYGLMDVETAKPVSKDAIYRIYSMSKPVTGVALMQLYEDGKFDLDDPVSMHIPEFADLKVLESTNEDGTPNLVDLERQPTMRELMSHSAGFAYGLFGQDYANTQFREQQILRSPDLDSFIEKVAGVPLLFQPGERWYYSAAVDIQGYLVEKFSGMSFGEYLESELFTPLNMDDTGFFVPDEDYDRLADVMAYAEQAGGFVPIYTENIQYKQSTIPFESGGGGLVSTMDDYARFCQMMLNEGTLSGNRILEPETIALMTTNQLPEGVGIGFDGTNVDTDAGQPHHFGLDWGIISDPDAMNSPAGTGTYYWGGAAGTWFWIDPENDLFFIGMIQRFGELPGEEADFRAESMRLVYEALEE